MQNGGCSNLWNMFLFDIDITSTINGKECHLEGVCEMTSPKTFTVTMTKPFRGLTTTKQFDNVEAMDMDATFSQVEKDLITLFEQETKRIESK